MVWIWYKDGAWKIIRNGIGNPAHEIEEREKDGQLRGWVVKINTWEIKWTGWKNGKCSRSCRAPMNSYRLKHPITIVTTFSPTFFKIVKTFPFFSSLSNICNNNPSFTSSSRRSLRNCLVIPIRVYNYILINLIYATSPENGTLYDICHFEDRKLDYPNFRTRTTLKTILVSINPLHDQSSRCHT